jgi:uncharacterized iron-regulated membrane protein
VRARFRQTMAWLHGWAGVVVGLILYAVFVSGTLSYFRDEISHWMNPELSEARLQDGAIAQALQILHERAANSQRWLIEVPQERRPTLRLGWAIVPERGVPGSLLRRFESLEIDPSTGRELQGRSTQGGDFFRQFHSQLSAGPVWGPWIVGACAMVMLMGIVSGVVTHGNIFRKRLTFRPGTGPRPWREAHNIAGVLALPYHVMITYTGLVTLMLMYMPAAVDAHYRFDPGAFIMEISPTPSTSAATGQRGKLAPIEPMLAEVSRRWDGAIPAGINIEHPGDAGARIHMRRSDAGRISANQQIVTFDGVSGAVLSSTPVEPPALHTYGVLRGWHFAHFAPAVLRWMFALCGMIGAAMVASGLMLWSAKRVPASGDSGGWRLGHRGLQILNLGTIVGVWWGVAGYFLANRLLPVDLPLRADWEVRCYFIVWGLSFVAAAMQTARRAWAMQFAVATLLFASLPLVNALTTRAHLGNSVPQGLWIYAGFDLAMFALAMLFAFAAARLFSLNERTTNGNRCPGRAAGPYPN